MKPSQTVLSDVLSAQSKHRAQPDLIEFIMTPSQAASSHVLSAHIKHRAQLICSLLCVYAYEHYEQEYIQGKYYKAQPKTLRQWMHKDCHNRIQFLRVFTEGDHFTDEVRKRIYEEDRDVNADARMELNIAPDAIEDLQEEQIFLLEDLLIRGLRPDPFNR